MTSQNGEHPVVYEFDGYRLDVGKRLLIGPNNEALPLKAKAFETLLFLVENAGRVIERDEIMEAVWPDTAVEENNLTQHVASLRRLFGETKDDHRFIATVPGHGYKFVAAVLHHQNQNSGTKRTVIEEKNIRRYRWTFVLLALIVAGSLLVLGFLYINDRQPALDRSVKSLAVLPFKPLVPAVRDEALEMGITQTLISKLSGVEELKVSPLFAVRRFGSPEQDTLSAGRDLAVDAVLDGSIQIAENRVRISIQLTRIMDGKVLWVGEFEQPKGDLFRLQIAIAEQVAQALQVPLGTRVVRDYTENVEAYRLYMNGELFRSRLALSGAKESISQYEQAIKLDPNYTLAYVGLAHAYRSLILSGDQDPADVVPKSKQSALRAVELDPGLSEAHVVLGNCYFWYDWDWQSAEQEYQKAIDLDSKNALAHLSYAHLLSNVGRHEQAIDEIQKSLDLEPTNIFYMTVQGQILTFAERYQRGLQVLNRVIAIDPNRWLTHLFLCRLYAQMGMHDEAIKEGELAKKLNEGYAEATSMIAYSMASAGNRDGARRVLSELEDRARTQYVPAYTIASIYNSLDNKEKALEMLERSFEKRDPLMVFLRVEPKWNNLRFEPRFAALMRKMKLDD